MSHKLQVGEMTVKYLTDKEIWGHFNYIFSPKSKNSTTYKFVLIKSILENLYNVNEKLELTYDLLFNSFSKIYWNLVIHHNLNQINMTGKKAEVQKLLIEIKEKYNVPNTFVFYKLAEELQLEIITKVKKKAKLNVMGAIYGDTNSTIYDFDNKKESIKINPSYYSFMQRFQKVLTYLTNYHLVLFLEKFNQKGDITNLLMKVENVSKRSSLNEFYFLLSSFYNDKCFYCGKEIKKKGSIHVDHFIPWSFVQTDQLWNLVISCSPCNLSKNDKLAVDTFLHFLIDRNVELKNNPSLNQRPDMKVYNEKKLIEIYQYSKENGFTDIWTPQKNIQL
ncbi:HNH endonuclease [Fictibacillus norfolkensis]|uniref:HNH endonuclease n=1 Tax=Fictibacillus norfolkensis TaxID=2762233 RepID=A0ABR8SR08_9BACL|nr:HNH endonuclease domain-containing protein [Fictibacillus norfolkensis]MBD7965891.1 HNH endonuclease [Fictibacillus norfolkensis]